MILYTRPEPYELWGLFVLSSLYDTLRVYLRKPLPDSGMDIKHLSGALGYYPAGFTLSTYTHTTTKLKRDGAEMIGKAIGVAL